MIWKFLKVSSPITHPIHKHLMYIRRCQITRLLCKRL